MYLLFYWINTSREVTQDKEKKKEGEKKKKKKTTQNLLVFSLTLWHFDSKIQLRWKCMLQEVVINAK